MERKKKAEGYGRGGAHKAKQGAPWQHVRISASRAVLSRIREHTGRNLTSPEQQQMNLDSSLLKCVDIFNDCKDTVNNAYLH